VHLQLTQFALFSLACFNHQSTRTQATFQHDNFKQGVSDSTLRYSFYTPLLCVLGWFGHPYSLVGELLEDKGIMPSSSGHETMRD